MNLAAVLDTIRTAGPVSRREIARATGLSRPTIDEVLASMLRAGYVQEQIADDDQARHRPGPRARVLSFRSDLGYVVGIDIGGDKILVLVSDLSGTIVGTSRAALGDEARASPRAVIERVRSLVDAALKRAGFSIEAIKAVGVSTPGVIDPASGRITLAPQLPNWEGLELRPLLGAFLPEPVVVDNEVRHSLVAERWRGAARQVNDALYFQVGYCIGAAILVGGELYRGSVGAAGEIGYLPLFLDRAMPDDGRGPFEYAAGGDAFARRGRELAESGRGSTLLAAAGGDARAIDARVVFECARAGNAAARELVLELVDRLAIGLAAGVVLLNPELVVIGGGVSRAGAALLEPLRGRLDQLVPVPSRVVLSALGDEAAALGAVRAAIDAADSEMFGFPTPRAAAAAER
jgi:predicted NBD/HSP70 family sugar kinase